MFLPVTLTISKKLLKKIKDEAKAAFPKEWLSYLIGEFAGTSQEIHDIYTPSDWYKYSTESKITPQPIWLLDAIEYADSEGLQVLGDIHSHPFDAAWASWSIGHQLSEADILAGSPGLAGIVLVRESAKGVLRASCRIWGPQVPVEMIVK